MHKYFIKNILKNDLTFENSGVYVIANKGCYIQ